MLTACSSDDDGAGVKNNAPSTQVFVMGQEVKFNAAAPVSFLATYAPAYYFVRVDNRIPNMGACKPTIIGHALCVALRSSPRATRVQ